MHIRVLRALAFGAAFAGAGISTAAAGIVVAGPMAGGSLLTHANATAGNDTNTAIAGGSPIDGDGVLDTVVFGWSQAAACSAVKIKVFRPGGDHLDFVGERGPIAVTWNVTGATSLTRAPLSPTIAVHRGDWLGIVGVNSGCGNPIGQSPGPTGTVSYAGDVQSTVSFSSALGIDGNLALALYASGNGQAEVFSGILAGIGSLAGAHGANFKTGLQATNAFFSTIIGRLVFHALGQPAGPNDPSFSFSLDPGQVGSADDIVAAVGLTGLWSADLYMSAGDQPPVVVARIFDDAGAAGTTGFTESLVDPTKVEGGTGVSVTGVLLTPPDLAKYRMNIGIRTIGGPVGVTVRVKDDKGNVLNTSDQVYGADTFFQLSAKDFCGGFDIGPNQSLVITFSNG
ncbi:MAG TPA: hypothetical protein VFL12_02725, partial [Thermoanaerobaculia bacterium]|nr:hypothetical protein [Thermoanaerobaculia bacterium]